ncbi:hypothetical protein DPMN_002712 [Dreissena polymorpha]|uniref:Uncharacterized protein n=1 Tax=Dreissena polymorpha TaxID=45954 RepID=A0A9D4MJN0_DREPO|nr:hypothetical protein DPMN_002712 [Dreissena polymorpha]
MPRQSLKPRQYAAAITQLRYKETDPFIAVQDNVRTHVLTKFHEEINYSPPGSHMFQQTGTIFKLFQDIIQTHFVTKFHKLHEVRTLNVASRVLKRFYYSHK